MRLMPWAVPYNRNTGTLRSTKYYTNHYNSNGINMLMGEGASDQNGARIALKFAAATAWKKKQFYPVILIRVINYTHDFNINPYAVIKMPSQRFELSSKNNALTEVWENSRRIP